MPSVLVSSVVAAAHLGMDRRTANKIARAGLLGETFTSDRGGTLVRQAAVDDMVTSKSLVPEQHPAAFVVRLEMAVEETGAALAIRPFRGWHANLAGHPDAVAGWDRWWPLADPDAVIGLPIVAQVGPVIVAVRTVNARPVSEFGRWRLPTTDQVEAAAASAFRVGRWLPLRPGSITAHLTDTR